MIKSLRTYFVLFPVIYLFVAIFILRGNVQYVYAAAGALVALTLLVHYRYSVKAEVFLAHWMIVLSAIGLSASVILSIEKIEILTHPNHIASCSISPIVACSPIIASSQASAFGFPNSFIGIFGFSAVFVAAMTILAGGAKLHKAWWRTLLAGILFGVLFCLWLIHEGVFEIGKL
jgi:uncharacterized membrane protein